MQTKPVCVLNPQVSTGMLRRSTQPLQLNDAEMPLGALQIFGCVYLLGYLVGSSDGLKAFAEVAMPSLGCCNDADPLSCANQFTLPSLHPATVPRIPRFQGGILVNLEKIESSLDVC